MLRFPLIVALAISLSAVAEAQNISKETFRPFLCCDHNGDQVCIVSPSGAIEWRMEAKRPQDCWLLPNGSILFCHQYGAIEADRNQKIVWQYNAPKGVECSTYQGT